MDENGGNEGKNLAQDKKREVIETEKYYQNVKLKLEKVYLDNVTVGEKHTKFKDEDKEMTSYNIYIDFKGKNVLMGTISQDGKIEPNMALLENDEYSDEEKRQLGNMLNILGLEQKKVNIDELQEQLKEREALTKEEFEKSMKQKQEETTKDDNEGKTKEQEGEEIDDKQKEQIAKQYNVNSKDIVHLNTKGEKITEYEDFSHLVDWAKDKDVYIIANKYGMIDKVIEKKDGKYNEIKTEMPKIHGNNPNVKIQRLGRDKITEVKPLKVHELDSRTALATVRNEWGEIEVLYCRRQEGKQEYVASVIPEKSGKNIRQLGQNEREIMSPEYNSAGDLSRLADNVIEAKDLDERGVPSKEQGVQTYEVNGTNEQNTQLVKENIIDDLYKRLGITEQMKAGLMPGQLEYLDYKLGKEADKIMSLMAEDKQIDYESAVEKVKREEGREPEDDSRDDDMQPGLRKRPY